MKNRKTLFVVMLLLIGYLFVVNVSATKYYYRDKVTMKVNESDYSGIRYIYIVNNSFSKWCGYYLMGGVIYINVDKNCLKNYALIMKHELRHHGWFRQNSSLQRWQYCNQYNLSGNKCAEQYADEGTYG